MPAMFGGVVLGEHTVGIDHTEARVFRHGDIAWIFQRFNNHYCLFPRYHKCPFKNSVIFICHGLLL